MAPRQDAAPFVPISPTVNIPHLLSTTPNWKPVQRIDARRINADNLESLQMMIHEHVVLKGIPLVIENWNMRSDWPIWVFNVDWLKSNHGTDQVNIRDIPNKADMPMTLAHYLNNMAKLTSKFSPSNYNERQQRLYGKDLDCPPVWRSSLANILPDSTFYLSERADLMSSLPKEARAENMMCYVGHEGTYTPAHTEMCATLGQNIMISASSEGANSEKGSSLWFMTQMADREVVAEYWTGTLGHDLSIEAHFASLEDLRKAPFKVYVLEQKVGDYVLVPPLAPHQVWNRGTYTVKAAWNRVTVDTLEHALREAIPKIRLVCRDEQYKTRAIVYDTLKKYTQVLERNDLTEMKALPPTMKDDYIRLYNLYTKILLDECFSPLLPRETKVELVPNEYIVTCSFCRGNIFNRFLSCKRCPPSMEGLEEDPYDVCMDCYSRGRSCFCVSGLSWVEQYPWVDLLTDHEKFRSAVIKIQKEKTEKANESGEEVEEISEPPQLKIALTSLDKERKGLARVCQEALQNRPYLDPDLIDDLDDEKEVAKKKREGKLLACHTCGSRHPSWKAMLCTTKDCGKAYCFGNLWRAYDMDPFDDCLAKHYWKCPVCLGVCSCGRCRKRSGANPYKPKGTILGAVTKHVADPRSVESLVDFGKGNVGWLINGVSGGKRKRGEGEGEYGGAISKWGPAFGAPDTAEPDASNEVEEPNIPEDFNDRNVVAGPVGYKAHNGAAGLDVASVPVDPNLELTSFGNNFGSSKKEFSGEYLKAFENPPDLPTSPRRDRLQAQAIAALSNDPEEMDGAQNQLAVESAMNPTYTNTNHEMLTNVNHANVPYNPFGGPQDAPTPTTAHMSALEKNPLAFLAAAGLMHSQQQEQGMAGANDWGNPYQDAYHYGGPALHPTETFASDDEQDAPSEPYGLSGVLQQYPVHIDPSLISKEDNSPNKPKRSALSKKERRERVQGDLEFEPIAETGVANWVKNMKSKKSRRKKGSLVVILKISPGAWRRHEETIAKEKEDKARKLAARFGLDDVGTDLAPDPKRRRVDPVSGTPIPVKKGRPTGSRKGYIEIEDDEEVRVDPNDLLSDDDDMEVMPTKSSRSNRTGQLVDGLTFEPTRRTSLNKSSRPRPSEKKSILSRLAANEEDSRTPIAYDEDDDESLSGRSPRDEILMGMGMSPSGSPESVGMVEPANSRNEAHESAIQKALREAKSAALAAAEGRSPPTFSAYQSEAASEEQSADDEDDEENEPSGTFQIAINPKQPGWATERGSYTPVRTDSRDGSSLGKSMSPAVIIMEASPKNNKPTKGPKKKTPLRPSRPLTKPGRPPREKVNNVTVQIESPVPSPKAAFTPVNKSAATPAKGTGKRGRPRKSDVTAESPNHGTESVNNKSLAKRPRNEAYSSTPKTKISVPDTTVTTTPKPRGRPAKNSTSTPVAVDSAVKPSKASPSNLGSTENPTQKKRMGRPPKSATQSKIASGNMIDLTALDASRSRNVIALLRHSPPVAEDAEDDWF